MGQRASWRSRSRIDRPLGIKPIFKAAVDALADRMLGPFTLKAVAELVLRVKTLRAVGSLTNTPDPTDYYDFNLVRSKPDGLDYVAVDENYVMYELALSAENLPANGTDALFHDLSGTSRIALLKAFALDEDDLWWCGCNVSIPNGSGITHTNTDSISVDLVLNCGTFPVTLYVPSGYVGDLTVTATEWFEYATRDGSPAWDAATGNQANGGPAA